MSNAPSLISVKDAVKSAVQFFGEMFPSAQSVRLEEVDMADDGPWWDITLSYEPQPPSAQSSLKSIIGQPERLYKLVQVDRETGEPRSIKIRKV